MDYWVQISDPSCGWITITSVNDIVGGSGRLQDQMIQIQRQYSDRRVRAIDPKTGALVNIL